MSASANGRAILCRMRERVPPHAYFVVSAVFHYLGPAFAVLLFARVDVLGVAWLRIAAAALVFARLAAAVASARGSTRGRRLLLAWGARARGDELLLLPGDRPAAARHGRRDRVPAGDRARGARRAHARATSPRWRWPCAGVYLLTDVQLAGEPLGRRARLRQRRPVRALHRARPPGGARTSGQRASTGWRRRCSSPLVVVTPLGGLGGAARRSPTRSRCSPASAWDLVVRDPVRLRPAGDGAPGRARPTR